MINEELTGNIKQDQLITAAWKLFNKHGIRRVSIEEICKNAKVSKMTFYKFFKNKVDLAKAVIDSLVSEGYKKYFGIMNEGDSFQHKIEQLLKMKIEAQNAISKEFLEDALEFDEEIRTYWIGKSRESQKEVLKLLDEGKKEGVIRKDLKPEFYLYMLQHSMEMLEDEKLKRIIPDVKERTKEITKFWFYGMFDAIG